MVYSSKLFLIEQILFIFILTRKEFLELMAQIANIGNSMGKIIMQIVHTATYR